MFPRNQRVEAKTATVTFTGVDTDGSGDVEVGGNTSLVVDDLRQIEDVGDVHAQAGGGYTANVQSVSGNTVVVRLFQSAGSAAAHAAVTSGSGVTDVTVEAEGV